MKIIMRDSGPFPMAVSTENVNGQDVPKMVSYGVNQEIEIDAKEIVNLNVGRYYIIPEAPEPPAQE